jgi:uncharacterized protein (TIGR02391 family)
VPNLLVSREQAKRVLLACAQRGNELATKAELAERTGGYRDWLSLFETWREETITELDALYVEKDVGREFGYVTETSEHSSPMYTFPHRTRALASGVDRLKSLVERLQLAVTQSPDATALASLHPEILSKCQGLFDRGDYAEAVEKGFKLVRDKLRLLTGHETGSEAFGKGRLYINGAAAAHVDDDFQNGVKFLTMAIDRFRNEKSHTADGNISDPVRAYEYLRLSSLAMHLLDGAQVRSTPTT